MPERVIRIKLDLEITYSEIERLMHVRYDEGDHRIQLGPFEKISLIDGRRAYSCDICGRHFEPDEWALQITMVDPGDPSTPWILDLCADRTACNLREAVRTENP